MEAKCDREKIESEAATRGRPDNFESRGEELNDGCRHCGERLIAAPVSELFPERVSPELRHLQAELAAQLRYRQAACAPGGAVAGNRRSKLCHHTQPNARCR